MMTLFIPLLVLINSWSSTGADFHGWMRKVREEPALFEIVEGEPQGTSPVWGSFVDKYASQGYGFLELYTNESYSDHDQAFNAGIFEGYATADRALMHYDNLWKQYCAHQSDGCVKLFQFIGATLNFMQQQVMRLAEKDPYWHQVDMVLTQLYAISAGINAKKTKQRFFSAQDLSSVGASMVLFLNLDGEVDDIEARLRPVATSDVHDDEPMAGRRADSALVKLLPGNKDLLLSHVSGSPYAGMTKVLKKYSLNLHTTAKSSVKISGNVHATSSSPGKLTSGDDFYLLSNGLALMSTGIEVHNNSLYRFITPNCVFEFVRAIVANRLATSARDWIDIYSKNLSGTNSKQWMIIDYNKFKSGQQVPDGLLWILESLPGFIHTDDVTAVLRKQSYWPSYNIPYSPLMFQLSGAPFNVQKYGDWFTYDKHPRAQIFKRDHVKVIDTNSMITLMRYNDFKHDPVSKCLCIPPFSAVNGISARSDLNMMPGHYPFSALGPASRGGVDMKEYRTRSELRQNTRNALGFDNSRFGSTARWLAERLERLRALAPRQPEVGDTTSHDAEPVKVELSSNHSANELRRTSMAIKRKWCFCEEASRALSPALGGVHCIQVTNASLSAGLGLIAVAGPTHDQQPPFRWSTSGFHDLHAGQPDLWNFAPFVCTWGKGNCQP